MTDDIRIRIAGDLADINKSLADLRRQTKGAGNDARGASRDFGGFGRQLDTLKRSVVGLVGAYAGFRGVTALFRGVIQATIRQEQALAQVEARVKSTGGAAGLAAEDLAAMARALQQATTFGDEEILEAQSLLLTFTQIAKDNFGEATEAVLNLSVAMGRDLNSVVQQVGKALNDPVLGLTALRESGIQFTAAQQQIIRSLVETGNVSEAQRQILAELETQFGGAARAARDTLGGALSALRNTAGDLLEADGGLPGVVESVNELNETLQDPELRRGLQDLATIIIGLVGDAAQTAAGLGQFATDVAFIGRQAVGATTRVEELEKQLQLVDRRLGELDRGGFSIPGIDLTREELEQLRRDLEGMLEIARAGGRGTINRGDTPAGDAAASPDPTDTRIDLRRLDADLKAAGTLLADEAKRIRAALDRELEQELVSYSEYFQRRAALETQQVDQALEQQRNTLALLDEELRLLEERGESTEKLEAKRAQLVAEITVLERRRGDVAANAAREQAQLEQALAQELQGVTNRLRELQGDTVAARASALEAEFRSLIQRLAIEGDEAGLALVQKLFNVELARAELDKIEADYNRTIAELGRQEQEIQTQVAAGAISEQEARRQTLDLYAQQAARVRALIPVMRELAEATGDPAAIERLREMEAELRRLETAGNETTAKLRQGFQDAAEDAVAGFLQGTRTIGDAFRGMVEEIVAQLARIASQQIVSGIFGALGAGAAHAGGIVGSGGSVRKVSPVEFIGAPRLHSGGIAGLGPGEVPTILKRGEEVLTEADPRHRNNRGGEGISLYVDARGAQDPAGILAAAEVLKRDAKAELQTDLRRGIKFR